VKDSRVGDEGAALELDRWREELITALNDRGLANTPINYSRFLTLTTFGDGHLHSSYTLRKDDFGNVIGIEAGESWRLDAPLLDDESMRVFAQYREDARLTFDTTLERLVSWIWAQAGDVVLSEVGAQELEDLLRSKVVSDGGAKTSPLHEEVSRKGGIAKNAGNLKKKERVIALYRKGDCKIKDKAAETIAAETGIPYQTVRKHLRSVPWRA
jgi:hypothetical protein